MDAWLSPGSTCCTVSTCCGESGDVDSIEEKTLGLGYRKEDILAVPEASNMGLGCGNSQAISHFGLENVCSTEAVEAASIASSLHAP